MTRPPLLDVERRRLLQGALAGAAVGVLPRGAIAQATQAAQAAQSVLGAPRHALVIGNDRYREAPLKNPVNDARAIAGELEAADFSVSLLLDASLEQMRSRVEAFGREIARSKSVGVFYFAGHGIQLAWRNYLLPVDTVINKMEEVRDRAVDLGQLLDSMRKAGNPANIVILDACRNNPFGRDFRVEQRGLSQVDAPVGTLLAYATAPGNVAIDGEGTNGLYTEHLLKEIRVPDAKVEDIFKRVRLAVRRQSKGVQIPWESTSLEEDFYFQLPEELRRAADAERTKRLEAEREAIRKEQERQRQVEAELRERKAAEEELQRRLKQAQEAARRAEIEAELRARRAADEELQRRLKQEQEVARRAEEARRQKAAEETAARQRADAALRRALEEQREAKRRDEDERERQHEEQLAAWDRIAESRDAAAFSDFIYRYPSGSFSELAQLRLDQLLAQQGERKVEIINAPQNPYTKGTARADTAFKVGDRYVYRIADLYSGIEARTVTHTVTAITGSEVIFNKGRLIFDLLGNVVQQPNGTRFTARQDQPLEYAVGKKWSTSYRVIKGEEEVGVTEYEYRIVARETITVPAGTFDCFRMEAKGVTLKSRAQLVMELTIWMAPGQVRRFIAREFLRRRYRTKGKSGVVNSERHELLSFKQG